MKKIALPFSFLLLLSSYCEAETIQSGRPGESIGAGILPSQFFQVQSGMGVSDSEVGDSLIFNNVFRKGINENFEMSAVIDYRSVNGASSGISSTQIGLRSRLIDEANGWVPQMAFQARINLNFVDSNFESLNKGLISLISMTHLLKDDLSLTHNFGMNYSGSSSASTFLWTSNLTKSLNDKWGVYAEAYGNRASSVNTTYGQTGLDYLINDDTKLDLSYAKRVFDSKDEDIISFGISARFNVNE